MYAGWCTVFLQRSVRVFVLSLATMVAVASIAPLPDQPETSFNENDAPVNCAIPVSAMTADTFPCETVRAVPIPRRSSAGKAQASLNATSLLVHWHAESLRELLCAFLI